MYKANQHDWMCLTTLKDGTAYLEVPQELLLFYHDSMGAKYCICCILTIAKEPPRVIDYHDISCTRPTNMIECVSPLSKMVQPTWKHSQYHHGASIIAWVQKKGVCGIVNMSKELSRVIDCHYISCTRPTIIIVCVWTLSNMVQPTWKYHKSYYCSTMIAWVQNIAYAA
jgi:hypothetical protein